MPILTRYGGGGSVSGSDGSGEPNRAKAIYGRRGAVLSALNSNVVGQGNLFPVSVDTAYSFREPGYPLAFSLSYGDNGLLEFANAPPADSDLPALADNANAASLEGVYFRPRGSTPKEVNIQLFVDFLEGGSGGSAGYGNSDVLQIMRVAPGTDDVVVFRKTPTYVYADQDADGTPVGREFFYDARLILPVQTDDWHYIKFEASTSANPATSLLGRFSMMVEEV